MNTMNPFIRLKKASQYGSGGDDSYIVNVHHIVRIAKSGEGSKVYTTDGEFYCDESPGQLSTLIDQVFGEPAQ